MNKPEDFRGDFRELAAMMKDSWGGNKQEPLLYTEEFMRSVLAGPGASSDLCTAIYEEGALVAFGAGFVRNVRYAGQALKLLLYSFVTVSPAFRGQKMGALISGDLEARAKRSGLDGLIAFCVAGESMDRKRMRSAQCSPLTTAKALTVSYLARPVPRNGTGKAQRADASILLRQSERLELTFRRIWTEAEAAWQCNGRLGAFGCSLGEGDKQATITAYTMLTGGTKSICCGLVEDVLWEGTDDAQRSQMIDLLLDSARALEVELLLIPVMHYFDPAPFVAAGFRKTRRTLNLYLTTWSDRWSPSELEAAYIDVF
jgi:hypothetical protein